MFNYTANIQQQKAFVKGFVRFFLVLTVKKIPKNLTNKFRNRFFGGFSRTRRKFGNLLTMNSTK